MEGITIRPEELRNSASEMKTKITAMKENLRTASNVMARTSDSFEASSADALRNKYEELKTKFDSFYEEMTSYAVFLEMTAATYEKADETIKKAANDILES
ncbi:MAG: WXG100 family type VII secretion target [Bacilli bacterium]|nr:WXG100 family type VII secretion target [Bacilli bacterium]